MKILIVSSEVAPFSKTGGLADVAGALPLALKKMTHCEVCVISPFYKMVKKSGFKIKKLTDLKDISEFGCKDSFELLESENDGVKFYFIAKDKYYDRDGLYGTPQGDYPDNAERFSFLCRAALTTLLNIKFYPDIIHANDWQTGLIPLYKHANFKENRSIKKSKVLFTIHNMAYEGRFEKEAIENIGLPEELIEPLRCQGKFSFIKSGIVYADAINTVSKKYAEEILTPQYGYGLDNILIKRKKDLYGILNGADYSEWNPATDPLIPKNYGIDALDGKSACKSALLKRMKIDISPEAPLFGSVGRLVEQKGIDLMLGAIDEIVKFGGGLALLGSGEERYENTLKETAREKTGKVGASITFDNKLAHMIEAGADMFIMPSRYEPCGLNQIYSLKYGAIPIVRATGGLDDTIIDYSEDRENGNGFKFKKAEQKDFIEAIKRATKVFYNKKELLKLQKRGMVSDFSWKHAAGEYMALYRKITLEG